MKHTISDGFPYYIQQLGGAHYLPFFTSEENFSLLEAISEEKASYRYAPDKWSIRQIVGHMTDHERIMTYRILRISRNDATVLPGYDQELLVANSHFDQLSLKQLLADFRNVRAATVSFIGTLSEAQLSRRGLVWKFDMTVADFLKATIGHELHHIQVLKEKYL